MPTLAFILSPCLQSCSIILPGSSEFLRNRQWLLRSRIMTALDVNVGSRSSFFSVWTSISNTDVLTQRFKAAQLVETGY
ncbi:hypothetical protein NOF04DRAFT_5678 [Fusarium oxysporum II5]|uniref:Uncharacterized protein n=2 Tax=Fusarium oxysporum species complex TaxID=171631 RepID=X0JRZ3_FUSO5|nr:uncharacterized protein FOIG_08973 [Fusarium odoratissimum NRRL 54006]EXL99095.1 hypothetical protein FOIG_08973 [Fusarium odoratissimum NRRL 54006]KAK2130333.1 hypothetical protein NOF04DRAFT_5678 [Fusarium oxysporum II5]TXC00780.1 hypothetical protein FocTR4_00009261 [Fusarium oxysporum f. sp. cubense]